MGVQVSSFVEQERGKRIQLQNRLILLSFSSIKIEASRYSVTSKSIKAKAIKASKSKGSRTEQVVLNQDTGDARFEVYDLINNIISLCFRRALRKVGVVSPSHNKKVRIFGRWFYRSRLLCWLLSIQSRAPCSATVTQRQIFYFTF
jgi:hypothetical protein